MFNYGQYWQADELSDIDLLVKLEAGDELFKLPAHKLVLSHSPFFKANVSTQVACYSSMPTCDLYVDHCMSVCKLVGCCSPSSISHS
jgi:hypothetical protein